MPRARIARRRSRPPYTSSPVTKAARIPCSCARCSSVLASSGLVANITSSGTPASSRCSSSAAHAPGRYSARSISAWPRDAAKVKVTATWHSAIPPAVPEYWRAAPTAPAEDFSSAVSSTTRTAFPSSSRATAQAAAASRTCWSSQAARQQMLQPVRATVPGRLGDAPAVVIFQLHQQPVHHLAGGLAALPPRKTPRYLPEQVLQQDTRMVIRYRGSGGCRFLIVCHDSS